MFTDILNAFVYYAATFVALLGWLLVFRKRSEGETSADFAVRLAQLAARIALILLVVGVALMLFQQVTRHH